MKPGPGSTASRDLVELGCVEGDPRSLLLRVDILRDDILCPILDFVNMYGYGGLLLPHFDAEIAPVTDLEGEALESIAPDWVSEEMLALQAMGEFANYSNVVPIPCP